MLSINKKLAIFILTLIFTLSCSPKSPKPIMTLAQYANQVTKIREVVNKLMSETDIVVMNYMADGVESTRAIPCDSVGEECNVYYEFLNKVVDLTKDKELSESDRAILAELQKKVYIELAKSEKIIQAQWKEFINKEESK